MKGLKARRHAFKSVTRVRDFQKQSDPMSHTVYIKLEPQSSWACDGSSSSRTARASREERRGSEGARERRVVRRLDLSFAEARAGLRRGAAQPPSAEDTEDEDDLSGMRALYRLYRSP